MFGKRFVAVITLAIMTTACGDSHNSMHDECINGICTSIGESDLMCSADQSTELFDRMIKPFVDREQPQSCNQCHDTTGAFNDFVRDDECTTMACLVEENMVDLRSPENSRLLDLILRAEPQGLVTQQMIDNEHDGFLQWISASAGCYASVCGVIDDPCGARSPVAMPDSSVPRPDAGLDSVDSGPNSPDSGPTNTACTAGSESPRYCCSDAALEDAFRPIWNRRGQCAPCHNESEDDKNEAMSYFFDDFGTTLDNVVGNYQAVDEPIAGSPLINCADPAASPIVQYPLSLEGGGDFLHGGGAKMEPGSQESRELIAFAELYCMCRGF